jgi:hypothetical protein
MERRWLAVALLLGLAAYMNALYVMYTSFAVAGFALVDWQHKRDILFASLLMSVLILPWLLLARGTWPSTFPENYAETLLMFAPGHFVWWAHSISERLLGLGILVVTASMIAAQVIEPTKEHAYV